jgi:hypothetical protein
MFTVLLGDCLRELCRLSGRTVCLVTSNTIAELFMSNRDTNSSRFEFDLVGVCCFYCDRNSCLVIILSWLCFLILYNALSFLSRVCYLNILNSCKDTGDFGDDDRELRAGEWNLWEQVCIVYFFDHWLNLFGLNRIKLGLKLLQLHFGGVDRCVGRRSVKRARGADPLFGQSLRRRFDIVWIFHLI